jgi:hypothetical protein
MKGRRKALIISSSKCDDLEIKQLISSSRDAEALAAALRDSCIGGFEAQVFIDRKKTEVEMAMEEFFDNSEPEDLLLLYISGWAIKDENSKLYFLTPDSQLKHLRATAVSAQFVNALMNSSRSQQVLLLDCCNIGKLADGMAAKADKNICTKEQFEGEGRVVLTASDAMQCYYEGDALRGKSQQSTFTGKLVQGLTSGEADLDVDGRVSIEDLYDYLRESATTEAPEQRPEMWSFGVKGDIVVAGGKPHPKSEKLPMQESRQLGFVPPPLATPAKPKQLLRYPSLECPDTTILDQRFSIFVWLLIGKPPEPGATAIIIEDTGASEKPPELEIVLSARGFDLEGNNTRVLQVDRNKDSNERFVLIPRAPGEQQIRVDFYQYGRNIGTVRHNVLVTKDPPNEVVEVKQPEVPVTLELRSTQMLPSPDLELYVELDRHDDRTLYFRLHSIKEEIGYHHAPCGQVTLKNSPLEKMQSVYRELSQMASQPGIDAERRMAAIGNGLWEELTPHELKDEYWHFKPYVKSMVITSDEPWIPWEMIKPSRFTEDGEREDDPFWCQQFALSRWLAGPGPAEELPKGVARPVAPTNINLDKVNEETLFIEKLNDLNPGIRGQPPISSLGQLLDWVERDSFSILHFATHGGFDSTLPKDSPIQLSDGVLRPSDIRIRFGGRRPRPLVFINACKGAQMEFNFTGLGGWAYQLVNSARVGAFAGAMWEVNDALALEFARRFYIELLRERQTIAQAFRLAREAVRSAEPSNSTWLAYTLYADPEVRIKNQE